MADALGDELFEMPVIVAQDRQRDVFDLDNHRLRFRALPVALATIVCNRALGFGDVS